MNYNIVRVVLCVAGVVGCAIGAAMAYKAFGENDFSNPVAARIGSIVLIIGGAVITARACKAVRRHGKQT